MFEASFVDVVTRLGIFVLVQALIYLILSNSSNIFSSSSNNNLVRSLSFRRAPSSSVCDLISLLSDVPMEAHSPKEVWSRLTVKNQFVRWSELVKKVLIICSIYVFVDFIISSYAQKSIFILYILPFNNLHVLMNFLCVNTTLSLYIYGGCRNTRCFEDLNFFRIILLSLSK